MWMMKYSLQYPKTELLLLLNTVLKKTPNILNHNVLNIFIVFLKKTFADIL